MNTEFKAIHRQRLAEEKAQASWLEGIERQIPYSTLALRHPQARAAIAALKNLSVGEQIEGIQSIPYYLISQPGADNSEINAVLAFLGCKFRADFAHGCSSPMSLSSSWGYFDIEKWGSAKAAFFSHAFVECKQPRTSIDALVFLLNL